MKSIILFFILLNITFFSQAQKYQPEFEKYPSRWADSVLQTLSLDEKIGQLIMVTAYSNQGESDERLIKAQIEKHKIGGVLFLRSNPHRLAYLTQSYQQTTKIPLFMAIDGENGLSFRMDSVTEYPHLMALGASHADTMIYRMGREIAQQCKTLGINMNFSPVADVNSNPENPIINYRSFGELPHKVAHKSLMLAKGMQDEKLLVFAKHFPGHGDTSTDSHHTLPVIEHNYERLDSIELVPFKHLIQHGINGIMTAHIHMKSIDKEVIPATMSKNVMQNLLRDSLGFSGIVVSDAMNMKGISDKFSESQATVEAFKAGVDLVEFIVRPGEVIAAVKKAIQNGELSQKQIDDKCRKVLMAKAWAGMHKSKPTQTKKLIEELNSKTYELTARELFRQSLTVIQNNNQIIPLRHLDTLSLATVALGATTENTFQKRISNYTQAEHFQLGTNATQSQLNTLVKTLKNYNLVIVSIHSNQITPGRTYGLSATQLKALEDISAQNKVILTAFTNVYALKHMKGIDSCDAIICAYDNHEFAQDYAAQLIFGAIGSNAKLPVSINPKWPAGTGINLAPMGRLQYVIPEEVGVNSQLLYHRIDSMMDMAISGSFFPGAQILAARNGKVFFQKAFGYHTFDSITPVLDDDLYDWASITKVTGPLPIIMKMVEDSIISLNKPFSEYYTPFLNTDKAKMTLSDILTHQAGFRQGIVFHAQVSDKDKNYKEEFIQDHPSNQFSIPIAPNLYLNNDFPSQMLRQIKDARLLTNIKYTYSDLGFFLFPSFITEQYKRDYADILEEMYLKPLGAYSVTYNPYNAYPISRTPPTEFDYHFRKGIVAGYVHDEGAALMGGISGNAGLFGPANDLAKIMQMYLQGGYYGGIQYLKPETVGLFTRKHHPGNQNRRALGFDKPLHHYSPTPNQNGSNMARSASSGTFGHTGFSGTAVWADPTDQVLFIFLSNRTFPNRSNLIITNRLRPNLHQLLYDLFGTFKY